MTKEIKKRIRDELEWDRTHVYTPERREYIDSLIAELDKPDEAAEHNADIACNMARKHIELKARADALAAALGNYRSFHDMNYRIAFPDDETGECDCCACDTTRAVLSAYRSGQPAAKKVPLAMLRECWEACNDPMNGEIMYRDIFGPIVARYGYEATE